MIQWYGSKLKDGSCSLCTFLASPWIAIQWEALEERISFNCLLWCCLPPDLPRGWHEAYLTPGQWPTSYSGESFTWSLHLRAQHYDSRKRAFRFPLFLIQRKRGPGLSSELTSVTTRKYPVKENEVGTMSETCKTLRPARLSLRSVIPSTYWRGFEANAPFPPDFS